MYYKKEINYAYLSLNIIGISLCIFIILAIVLMITDSSFIARLGSVSMIVMFISFFIFFASAIYTQFKDKRFLWGIINVILIILWLVNYGEENDIGITSFIIVLISCLWYYFHYIKPKFKSKRKAK